MNILLRQLLFINWLLVTAWLGCEWLMPGSMSVFLPIFLLAGMVIFLTLGFADRLALVQRRAWFILGWLTPIVGALALLFIFLAKTTSLLVVGEVICASVLGVCALLGAFLPDSSPSP